jgi:hypothetical protein
MELNNEIAAFENLHIQVLDSGLGILNVCELNIAESAE